MTDHPGLSGSCFCLLRTPARHQQPTQARRWRLPSSGLHRQDRAGAVACGRNPREERAPGRRTRAPVRRIPPGAAPCRKDSGANGPATARRRGGARPRVWIAAGARGARPDSCSMGRRRPPRPPAARFWISLPCVFCTLRPVGSPPIAGIPGPTEARRGLAGWRTCCQGCPARERPARSQRGFGALARPVPTAALSASRLSLSAAPYKDLALPACATVPSVRLRAPCWASPNRHCLGGNSPALHTYSASWHRSGLNGCLCLQSTRAARPAATGHPPMQASRRPAFPCASALTRAPGPCYSVACLEYPRTPEAADGSGLLLVAYCVWAGLRTRPCISLAGKDVTNAPAEPVTPTGLSRRSSRHSLSPRAAEASSFGQETGGLGLFVPTGPSSSGARAPPKQPRDPWTRASATACACRTPASREDQGGLAR